MAEKALSNIVSIVIISLIFIAVFATEVLKPRMEVNGITGVVGATYIITSNADNCPDNADRKAKVKACETDDKYWFDTAEDVCACTCRKYQHQTNSGTRLEIDIARTHTKQENADWLDYPICGALPNVACCAYDAKSKLSMFSTAVPINPCEQNAGLPIPGSPKPKSEWAPPSKA